MIYNLWASHGEFDWDAAIILMMSRQLPIFWLISFQQKLCEWTDLTRPEVVWTPMYHADFITWEKAAQTMVSVIDSHHIDILIGCRERNSAENKFKISDWRKSALLWTVLVNSRQLSIHDNISSRLPLFPEFSYWTVECSFPLLWWILA